MVAPVCSAQEKTVAVIAPVQQEEISADIQRLLEKAQRNFLADRMTEDDKDELEMAADHAERVYVVDVNNDGNKEYVFCSYEGSAHVLTLVIVAEDTKEDSIKLLQVPHTVPRGLHEDFFYNELNGSEELFLDYKGAIYLSFGTTRHAPTRDIYYWKDTAITWCCDAFWIAQQKALCTELCRRNVHASAYSILRHFEERCRHDIDPLQDLSLRLEVALAAAASGYPRKSLEILTSITYDTAYQRLAPEIQERVQRTKLLSTAALTQSSRGTHDYQWLCSYRGKDSFELREDAHYQELFQALVPDVPNLFGQSACDSAPSHLRDYIQMLFEGPGDIALTLENERYMYCSGFRPHAGGECALFWCDLTEKISVVAVGIKTAASTEPAPLYLISRSLLNDELPQAYYNCLHAWLKKSGVSAKKTYFYDRLSVLEGIVLPSVSHAKQRHV